MEKFLGWLGAAWIVLGAGVFLFWLAGALLKITLGVFALVALAFEWVQTWDTRIVLICFGLFLALCFVERWMDKLISYFKK